MRQLSVLCDSNFFVSLYISNTILLSFLGETLKINKQDSTLKNDKKFIIENIQNMSHNQADSSGSAGRAR